MHSLRRTYGEINDELADSDSDDIAGMQDDMMPLVLHATMDE
jgi:hypothetical protein